MQIINKDNINDQIGGNWACFMGCTSGCLILPSAAFIATATTLV